MNNDTHKWFEELIEVYLADGLQGDELSRFKAHYSDCAGCCRALDDARQLDKALIEALSEDRAPEELPARISAAIAEERTYPMPNGIRGLLGGVFGKLYQYRLAGGLTVATLVLMFFMAIVPMLEARSMMHVMASPSPDMGKTWWQKSYEKYTGNASNAYTAMDVAQTGLGHTSVWAGTEMMLFGGVGKKNKGLSPAATPVREMNGMLCLENMAPGDAMADEKNMAEEYENSEKLLKGQAVYDSIAVGGGMGGAVGRSGGKRASAKSDSMDKNKDGRLAAGYVVGETGDVANSLAVLNPSAAILATNDQLLINRKIIKSGSLQFEVEIYEVAYQKVVVVLTQENGYIASSQSSKLANGKVQGEIVIRVLPERFDSVVVKLKSLGELKNQQVDSQDITKQYVDLQARLKNSQALEERLVKLMDKKGEVKDLLSVEKEMAATREKIEQLQGEIKYYDNMVSLSTIRLSLSEKDIAKPFEYVQTQSANLVITVPDVITAYQQAQAMVLGFKGQVAEAQVTNQNERAIGTVRAFADADQFANLLEQLKSLGEVKSAVTEQKQSAPQGVVGDPNTPVRKERGLVNLTLNLPAGRYIQTRAARIEVEAADVDAVYAKAQSMAQSASAKITNGKIDHQTDGVRAVLSLQIEADKFKPLMDSLKGLGKVLASDVSENQVSDGVDPKSLIPAPVRKEPGAIELAITSPSKFVSQEYGFMATIKSLVRGGIGALLFSLEAIVVFLLTVGPWVLLIIAIYVLIKKVWGKKK
ncbi:MAG: DUF4349 domain-containing protein [Candidatus Brocadiia bacterium]